MRTALAILKAAYPQAILPEETVRLWVGALSDVHGPLEFAVRGYVLEHDRMPSIAQIVKAVKKKGEELRSSEPAVRYFVCFDCAELVSGTVQGISLHSCSPNLLTFYDAKPDLKRLVGMCRAQGIETSTPYPDPGMPERDEKNLKDDLLRKLSERER